MPSNKKKKESKKRVLKEKRKKDEKKVIKSYEELKEELVNDNSARKNALNYLIVWKEQKEEWKFNKAKQIWLIKSMYSLEKVPSKYFKILLKYLEDLKGDLKKRLIKEGT